MIAKIKPYLPALLSIVLILVGLFYWYEWRPRNTRVHCTYAATERVHRVSGADREDYEYFYQKCLREYGLGADSKITWK